jgi:preprotein translocase subunit SecG
MLTFLIWVVTGALVIDCVFLVMLVLIQLPKKEAGMGQAFGGAATDALFGAGSGNVLTKATKWGAAVFFALAIALTIMGTYKTTGSSGRLQRIMSAPGATPTPGANVPATNTPAATVPGAAPNAPAPNTPIQLGVPKADAPAVNVPATPPSTNALGK